MKGPKDYWNQRIEKRDIYSSIGHQGYTKKINKVRKESLFDDVRNVLEENFETTSGLDILDLGCGTGIYSKFYSKLGANVKGIDISDEAIKSIRNRNLPGEYKTAKSSEIPFDKEFDAVHCFSVLYHIIDDSEWKKTLNEIYNHTRDEGLIILRISWNDEKIEPADHVKMREESKYLEWIDSNNLEILDKISIKDEPVFAKHLDRLPKTIANLAAHPKLMTYNEHDKVILLKKT
jgi:SAM-dependent methyltransferase